MNVHYFPNAPRTEITNAHISKVKKLFAKLVNKQRKQQAASTDIILVNALKWGGI